MPSPPTSTSRCCSKELTKRIEGNDGLAKFLERQATKPPIGPIVIGSSRTPVGARVVLPPLEVGGVRVVGTLDFAWRTPAGIELLVYYGRRGQRRWANSAGSNSNGELFSARMLGLLAMTAVQIRRSTRVGSRCMSPEGRASICIRRSAARCSGRSAARDYLDRLVRDFLDPTCAEILPYSVVHGVQLERLRPGIRSGGLRQPRLWPAARRRGRRGGQDYKMRSLVELGEAGIQGCGRRLPKRSRDRFGPLLRAPERAQPVQREEVHDGDFDDEAFEMSDLIDIARPDPACDPRSLGRNRQDVHAIGRYDDAPAPAARSGLRLDQDPARHVHGEGDRRACKLIGCAASWRPRSTAVRRKPSFAQRALISTTRP